MMWLPDERHVFLRQLIDCLEFDLQGWGQNFPLYERLINDMKPKIIVEVGVWKGSSTIFMANELKKH